MTQRQETQYNREAPYSIVTNRNQRRILVINDVVNVDHTPEIHFEDFDAIFINVIDSIMDRVMLAIRLASPLQSEKCRFKPCYVTRRLTGWLGKAQVIIDGYATSPDDNSMARGIEDIYANMRRQNFLLGTDPVVTHAEEVVRLCRFAISRGKYTFSSQPTPGLSEGYMALYYYTLWFAGQQTIQAEERDFFHNQLLRLGYIRRNRFIDVSTYARYVIAATFFSSRRVPTAGVPTCMRSRCCIISDVPMCRRNTRIRQTENWYAQSVSVCLGISVWIMTVRRRYIPAVSVSRHSCIPTCALYAPTTVGRGSRMSCVR